MKKLSSVLLIAFACLTIVGCNSETIQGLPIETSPSQGEADISVQNFENYSLEYVSNKDGTCYVNKIITEYVTNVSYDLIIPDVSPNGDKVTEIVASLYKTLAPSILVEEDYNKILSTLQKKVETAEISNFDVTKYFASRYVKISISEMSNDETINRVKEKYPFSHCMTDFYAYDPGDIDGYNAASDFLKEYADYDITQLKDTYQHLYETCESKLSDPLLKEEVLSWLSRNTPLDAYGYGNCMKSIRLPENLEKMPIGIYQNCIHLTEITFLSSFKGISEIDLDMFVNIQNSGTNFLKKINVFTEVETIKGSFNCPDVIVTLPASVKNLENAPFITNINEIHYLGTKAQWQDLIMQQFPNTYFSSGNMVYCSDGTIKMPHVNIYPSGDSD